MDYTVILQAIKDAITALSVVFTDPVTGIGFKLDGIKEAIMALTVVFTDPVTGIGFKLDSILAKISATPVASTTNANTDVLLAKISEQLLFLTTASLWSIGIIASTVVCFIVYRVIAKFIEF